MRCTLYQSISFMDLKPGAKLGPYEILSPLGEGGMGEVWKARDTRLDRDVALKVSKAEFTERFEREARAIAAFNHPNICHLYDVGPNYLVMELIDGAPLTGPVPVEKAVDYSRQILDALNAAHRKGITHRDLKPANILVSKQGIKLLDFGLAKQRPPGIGDDVETRAAITKQGQISGTLQYMAPEQLQGKEADARTDIFAFGCVLFEMLTGRRAFDATSPSIGAVASPGLDRVLQRCLAKDPDDRWQTARDLKAELEWVVSAPVAANSGKPSRAGWLAAAVLALFAAALGASLWRFTRHADRPGAQPMVRLDVDLGPGAVAISPDNSRIVFDKTLGDGNRGLATRLLYETDATLLPGTENGTQPFFSPDGQWLGFLAGDELGKIAVKGGAPVKLADLNSAGPRGMSWGENGDIIIGTSLSGLLRLPAAATSPSALTTLGPGEITHRWPQVLPRSGQQGDNNVLFTSSGSISSFEGAAIEVLNVKNGQRRVVQRGGYFGRYLPVFGQSGYLVFVRNGTLLGVLFDPDRMEVTGQPVPVLADLTSSPDPLAARIDSFSVSASPPGMLVYHSGKASDSNAALVWMNSSGKTEPLLSRPDLYFAPRISPDGERLAVLASSSTGQDLFVYDLKHDTFSRLTSVGRGGGIVWAPDSSHIFFYSGSSLLYIRTDDAGEPVTLLKTSFMVPYSVTPDSRHLAYFQPGPKTSNDIWILPLDTTDPEHPRAGKPELFLGTPAAEVEPRFSPDGRWIAYSSVESGRGEVYVRPFPGPGGKSQISAYGGTHPVWSHQQLFFMAPDRRIMAADYSAQGDTFTAGKARVWSNTPIGGPSTQNLDLAPDGKRFVVFEDIPRAPKETIHVTFLLNFFDELRRRIPDARESTAGSR